MGGLPALEAFRFPSPAFARFFCSSLGKNRFIGQRGKGRDQQRAFGRFDNAGVAIIDGGHRAIHGPNVQVLPSSSEADQFDSTEWAHMLFPSAGTDHQQLPHSYAGPGLASRDRGAVAG